MSTQLSRDARVAVIGGSLVGPATELLLRRAGFTNVTTYEASTVTRPTSGGVMGLRTDTVTLLNRLGIDPDPLVALNSNVVTSFDVHDGEVTLRGSSDFPGITSSWDALHGALTERVNVVHGKRVSDLVQGATVPDEAPVSVEFTDAIDRLVDLVIFADGRRSTGRAIMDPDRDATMSYQGYVTWRGLVTPPTTDALPHSEPLDGFHRYYDPDHGTLFSLTAPINQSGLSYWEYSHNLSAGDLGFLFHPPSGTPVSDGPPYTFMFPRQVSQDARATLARATRQYGLPEALRTLIEQTNDVMLIPVNDLPLPTRAQWRLNGTTVALVGDALIPARLQVGAGLNMGIKQAAALVRYLASGQPLGEWEREAIDEIAPWIELGRSRAHRSNLGNYTPVFPGRTAVPETDVWSTPRWVAA